MQHDDDHQRGGTSNIMNSAQHDRILFWKHWLSHKIKQSMRTCYYGNYEEMGSLGRRKCYIQVLNSLWRLSE